MGFSCGIYKAKRYNDAVTPKTVEAISSLVVYEHNDWAKENYKTYEDYAKNYNCLELPNDKEMIDFYRANAKTDKYGNVGIMEEIDSWCSSGRAFDDWFGEFVNKKNFYGEKEVSKDIIVEALKKCNEELDQYELVPVMIERSFVEDESGDIKSQTCDGVEVVFEDGRLKRIYTTEFEMTEVFCPVKLCPDGYETEALKQLRDTLINILCTVDFDKEIVIYEGGY